MTVKELKDALAQYPETMDVFISETTSDFPYGLLNEVYSKEIGLSEEPGGKVLSRETVVILQDI